MVIFGPEYSTILAENFVIFAQCDNCCNRKLNLVKQVFLCYSPSCVTGDVIKIAVANPQQEGRVTNAFGGAPVALYRPNRVHYLFFHSGPG
jgi:hypothetical protein